MTTSGTRAPLPSWPTLLTLRPLPALIKRQQILTTALFCSSVEALQPFQWCTFFVLALLPLNSRVRTRYASIDGNTSICETSPFMSLSATQCIAIDDHTGTHNIVYSPQPSIELNTAQYSSIQLNTAQHSLFATK